MKIEKIKMNSELLNVYKKQSNVVRKKDYKGLKKIAIASDAD